MLGKIMKYEWRGLRFPLLLMAAILGGITVLICAIIFMLNPKLDNAISGFTSIMLVLCFLFYFLGIMVCSLGSMLIIAIRFYKSCYTDNGYLTHTLPVKTTTLLAGKVIMSAICYLLMFVWIGITVVIIGGAAFVHIVNLSGISFSEASSQLFPLLSTIADEFRDVYGTSLASFAAYFIVVAIISAIACTIIVLGCVSLGQLYAKHRIVGAIIAYFGVQIVQQIVSYISSLPIYSRMLSTETISANITLSSAVTPSSIVFLVFSVVLAVAMYFINLHMMTKRLNLE